MKYNLEKSVNHRIATIAQLLKRQVFRIIAENQLNITPDQWVVLYYLWEENGLSVGELAAKSKKDFANVTRIVDKLIKLGYVEKKRSEKDSRSSNVYVLPQADEIKDKIFKCWTDSTDIATKGLDNSEQQILLSLLQRIEDNIISNMK